MSPLRVALLADGPTDEAPLAPLEWLLRRHLAQGREFECHFADLTFARGKPRGLVGRVAAALCFARCDLLVVHRDAENAEPDARRAEIRAALESLNAAPPWIPLVPRRMTEAWFLFSEAAIRSAAGNPRGVMPLNLPPPARWESIPDPKAELHELLRIASGLRGRRLEKFRVSHAARRLADHIEDYSPLARLAAFQQFEADLKQVLGEKRWS